MENTTHLKYLRLFAVGILALHQLGCASVTVTPRGELPSAGPAPEPLEVQGPPSGQALKPLVLVLSPGKALAFSHVGVLRSLAEAKIPVAAILGTEIGGLIGALYSATGKLQKLEWGLLRFKEDVFTSDGGLLSLIPGRKRDWVDPQKLEKALQLTFGALDIKDSKVPLRLFAMRSGGDASSLILMNGGPLRLALRAAASGSGLFEPSPWEGQKTESARALKPYPVSEARELFPGAVVLTVDAMPDAERPRTSGDRDSADFVVRPDFAGVSEGDYAKRNEIAFRGKAAIGPILLELRRSMGLPEVIAAPERGEEE